MLVNLKDSRFSLLLWLVAITVFHFLLASNIRAQSPGVIQQSLQQRSSDSPTHSAQDAAPVTAYTLSPERYREARELGRAYFIYELMEFVVSVLVLLLMLRFKIGVIFARWAQQLSQRRVVQAFTFTPLVVLVLVLSLLPAEMYRHSLSMRYGLSIQGWQSWFWDWTKFQLVLLILASFTSWILYTIIRKSSRRWWFYFWLASLPLSLFLVFFQPLIFDPLFHKFEPLAQKEPVLAKELQKLVARTGENIPPERMFWMEAGNKTTTLNAYVTGFAASKRVVVWDTTISKMTTPQIVFVAGHEMGHYVLHHILKGLLFGAIALLGCFYAGKLLATWLIKEKGNDWQIHNVANWSSMPLLLLLFTVISFLMNPIVSSTSRYFEHQADQYALEVTHGLIPDSNQVGAHAFQLLGDFGLADPYPNPVDVFLYYDHPPIAERVEFSLHYDPWSNGKSAEFVK